MSKYQKYVPDDNYIYPHKHCKCGHMMREDQEFCSKECAAKWGKKTAAANKKYNRKKILIWVGVIAAALIIVLVFLR